MEEFRAADEPEQEIFGNSSKVWERCTVQALFAASTDVDAVLAQWQARSGSTAPLKYEAGGSSGCAYLLVLSSCMEGGKAGAGSIPQSVPQYKCFPGWLSRVAMGPGVKKKLAPMEFFAQVEEVPDQEWMDSVRASYQPARIGDGLWIVPTWCTPPEPSATNIILEPGLAFGTGEHPTTRLCLRALARLPLSGKRVIDYGTGEACATHCVTVTCAPNMTHSLVLYGIGEC